MQPEEQKQLPAARITSMKGLVDYLEKHCESAKIQVNDQIYNMDSKQLVLRHQVE